MPVIRHLTVFPIPPILDKMCLGVERGVIKILFAMNLTSPASARFGGIKGAATFCMSRAESSVESMYPVKKTTFLILSRPYGDFVILAPLVRSAKL